MDFDNKLSKFMVRMCSIGRNHREEILIDFFAVINSLKSKHIWNAVFDYQAKKYQFHMHFRVNPKQKLFVEIS